MHKKEDLPEMDENGLGYENGLLENGSVWKCPRLTFDLSWSRRSFY